MLRFILLTLLYGGASAGSHSLRYFYTSMTPISGLPEFVTIGYVDELEFVHYDSDMKKTIPRQRWIAESEGPDYWERQTQIARGWEQTGKVDIQTLMTRTNQSGGIHVLQRMYGCELREDGSTGGFFRDGWDAKDSIVFDKEHLRWIAVGQWAVLTKEKWDKDQGLNQQRKGYLEGICIEWLKKYLRYGERQLRPAAPTVSFTRLGDSKKLSCVATGFYPQSIELKLHRDQAAADVPYSSGVRPNHDGTYQMEKQTDFEPSDPAKFSCEVDHAGLSQKLVMFYEPKADSMLPVIIGIVIAVLVLVALAVVGVVLYRKKAGQKTGYNPAKTSDKAESSSNSSATA
uniref:MHC class I antigen n=1 Tax=Triakis scyllium TaxID=30494 RepID=O46840_TRISC|nr:MHC class I antigen [Triakis scyllium]